jgi:hypothetical protein
MWRSRDPNFKKMKSGKTDTITSFKLVLGLVAAMAAAFTPASAHACACGCGVFDVGTSAMFPEGSGGMAFLDYDYQDQNQNWSGNSSGAAANNGDKEIETHFATIGLQYMFNRSWGAQLELPVWNRTFTTDLDFGNGNPEIVSKNWTGLGDIRLKGIYTGFSEDLSSGLTFGVKLPTGSDSHDPDVVDRDTQIGTGSTDLLLGAFHRARFRNSNWSWFGQAELDLPLLKTGNYRPGIEGDAAVGVYYDGLALGRVKISPVAQVIGSWRGRDNGADANPGDSGYQRVLLSPGIEFHLHPVKIYADVEIPVYQNMNGNQLVAPALVKVSLSYMF